VLDDVLAATEGRTVVLITHDPAGLDRLDGVVELPGPSGPARFLPTGGAAVAQTGEPGAGARRSAR
jgi:hypothetical protein